MRWGLIFWQRWWIDALAAKNPSCAGWRSTKRQELTDRCEDVEVALWLAKTSSKKGER